MILLTGEEIITKLKSHYHWSPDDGGVYATGDYKAIAKAQLKSVVEWEGETCYEHLSPLGGLPLRRKDCEMCWQALLEETKEG